MISEYIHIHTHTNMVHTHTHLSNSSRHLVTVLYRSYLGMALNVTCV